jgi:hypothetical protein
MLPYGVSFLGFRAEQRRKAEEDDKLVEGTKKQHTAVYDIDHYFMIV